MSWSLRLIAAETARRPLRLRLHLNSLELWDWPWELLRDPKLGFLAVRTETPVVRYIEMTDVIRPLRVRPPIRVLAVSASPAGFSPLAVKEELADLESALKDLLEAERVELDRLEGATQEGLRRKLAETSFHILHFIGHGTFGAGSGGRILLQREDGAPDPLGGEELSVLLGACPDLRLVVLNACQGARGDAADPFAGMAQRLVHGRLPAVVAMRSAVTDRAAIAFSQHFYAALSRREPVDRAVSAARHAMFMGESAEWASPVLAMRSPDGRVFALFWWEVLWDRVRRIAGTWKHWLVALLLLVLLAVGLKRLARGAIDPNLVFVFLNPPECPPPPGLAIAFVKVDPGPPLRPFCLGRFEVTQRIWRKVMGTVQSRRREDALPALRVSWNAATRFLDELERREPAGRFRLPTGVEWEFAAWAGANAAPQPSAATANCDNQEEDDGFEGPAPVGSYLPNDLGLYDMLGNAAEWTDDEGAKVRRGGSFKNALKNCSVTFESFAKPDSRYEDSGLRIIRDPLK